MNDKLEKIITYYGLNKTLRKLHEEHFELDESIIRYNGKNKDNIAEELSDMLCVLSQLIVFYDFSCDEIISIIKRKVDRQLKRMEEENGR